MLPWHIRTAQWLAQVELWSAALPPEVQRLQPKPRQRLVGEDHPLDMGQYCNKSVFHTLVLPISKVADPSALARTPNWQDNCLSSFGLLPSSLKPSGLMYSITA